MEYNKDIYLKECKPSMGQEYTFTRYSNSIVTRLCIKLFGWLCLPIGVKEFSNKPGTSKGKSQDLKLELLMKPHANDLRVISTPGDRCQQFYDTKIICKK